jgi:formyl-CoA transferase
VEQRDMIARLEQPGLDRRLTVVGTPIKMTGTPTGIHQRAPLLGEHSESVLTTLGYRNEQIQQLANDGVVVLNQDEAIAATKG